jgi:arginine deiminase
MSAKIKAEWNRLRKVALHTPGIEMYFGLLDPYASLYEKAFSRCNAIREHERLAYTLKHEFKVDVIQLKDTITSLADKKPEIHEKLVSLALKSISFTGNSKEVKLAKEEMEKNKKVLDSEHFFKTMLLHPSIELETGKGTRMIQIHVTESEPLSNLYFMRDQQAVTDKGIVISSMSKPQRRREPWLTKLLWEILKEPIIYEIKKPATFEGGDFIPMKDFALIGIGDRTNEEGIKQMLNHGISYDEVGVVHQPNHPLTIRANKDPMINMHLDTYFNVASKDVAVGCEELLKNAEVEIYHRNDPDGYLKAPQKMNLHDYMLSKGFQIINITTLEQMAYASNFLCIKNGTILAVEVDRIIKDVLMRIEKKAVSKPIIYEKLLNQVKKDYKKLRDQGQFFPHKKEIYQQDIDAYPLILENITGGYGGAHCMTCPINRT